MKRILILIMVLFLAATATAQLCEETDNGIDYDNKGSVKYGVTTLEDTCILSKHTEMSVEESVWLKEYYCDNDQRKSDTIDCTREGYLKCALGVCTGKENVTAQKEAEQAAQPKCGNDVVDSDLGEECDPPGKICFADGGYGQCDEYCKCPLEIGDSGVVKKNETTANATATNATANVTAPAAENVTAEEPAEEPLPEIEKIEPVEVEPEPEVEEIEIEQPLPNFVVRFVNWIKSLFS